MKEDYKSKYEERTRMYDEVVETCENAADRIKVLEIQLHQARGALGFPVPGNIPESDIKCGLCANKEKDYVRVSIEKKTLWEAFRLLAESR